MKIENSTKTEDILRASAEYVLALRKIADKQERSADINDPEVMEYTSALHLSWLLAKHQSLWFKSAETEAYVNEMWPDIECFSALDFELTLKNLLQLIDGDTYFLTKSSHDQGIDLIHERRLDLNFDAFSKTIVQCKLYRGYVPVSELRDFFGVMAAHVATGLFATTGMLTSQGTQFVPLANSSPHANRLFVISSVGVDKLFDIGSKLTDLILHNDVNIEEESEFTEWAEKLDSLRTSGHKLLWSACTSPIQQRLL
jgi:hypothetical protein